MKQTQTRGKGVNELLALNAKFERDHRRKKQEQRFLKEELLKKKQKIGASRENPSLGQRKGIILLVKCGCLQWQHLSGSKSFYVAPPRFNVGYPGGKHRSIGCEWETVKQLVEWEYAEEDSEQRVTPTLEAYLFVKDLEAQGSNVFKLAGLPEKYWTGKAAFVMEKPLKENPPMVKSPQS